MNDSDQHDSDRAACIADLSRYLGEARNYRQAAAADPEYARRRDKLRNWQAKRLAATHADLLASSRYKAAATFFLNEVYGPKDLSERDAEVEKIFPLLTSVLPVSALRALVMALEVDALSERFDAAMVKALGRRLTQEELTAEEYAVAYRKVGQRSSRELQIRLIGETGELLDSLSHKSFIRGALKMMHGPAQLAGLGELHGFLQRGFDAFRGMRDADEFLEKIVGRETEKMRELFSEH